MKKDNKSSWGGKRPGSGRKPSDNNSEIQREIFERLVDAKFEDLINKQIELALKGNTKLLIHLINQRIGKPQEYVNADVDGSLTIKVVSYGEDYTPPVHTEEVSA